MDLKVEIPSAFSGVVELPASKSITARALIVNALAGGNALLRNVARCDDTNAMLAALTSRDLIINVGAAGTAMRFLTAFFASHEGRTVVLDGTGRMRERPVGPLVDALRQMGAEIDYLGNEGFPPLKITGRRLNGGNLAMRGDVSSQFTSALLMVAPAAGGLRLTLEGEIVSRPYIDMTLGVMRHYGIDSHWTGNTIEVPSGQYVPAPLTIEGDWSAASYWFAVQALLPQSAVTLKPLLRHSLQGDSAIIDLMTPLGVKATWHGNELALGCDTVALPRHYCRDMASTPDLVPTLAVALCLLRVPFTLTGVRNLRIKESDRLDGLTVELAKLGYRIKAGDDTLHYDGNHHEPQDNVVVDPHDDHRLAMALSLAATRHHGITIKNAHVVTKSYPNFFSHLLKTEN